MANTSRLQVNLSASTCERDSALQNKENQVLQRRGCPITITAATEGSREIGGQGLPMCLVSIIHT